MTKVSNSWLDTVPAETMKGNDTTSESRVKDLTRDQIIALLGPGYIIDSLPDAHPEIAPSHVAVTQISSYVDGGYVEEGYFTEGEPTWAKMTFEDFNYWIGQFEDTSYVKSGYVESGYIAE